MDMEADGLIKNHAGHLILCVNSGSSSIKFSLYQLSGREEHLVVDGIADRIGLKTRHLRVFGSGKNNMIEVHGDFPDHKTAVRTMFAALGKLAIPSPAAVGHRLVHGGTHHTTPTRIDPDILRDLEKLIPFAPLHLPSEILCIKEISDHFPGLPQAACFDTAFHHRMPELAQRFPLPRDLWAESVRRYGFHGLSY